MNPDLIYAKTASGEEAMYQRTRVMQRNARMVLILVDGQSTVADLSHKTGNPQLTENALQDLEKAGFIEPRQEQDSIWAESKKFAHEIPSAAINKANEISSPGIRTGSEPSAAAMAMSVPPVSQTPTQNDSSLPQYTLARMQSFGISGGSIPPVMAQEEPEQSLQKQTLAAEVSGKSFVGRVKELLSSAINRSSEHDVLIEPIRRGKRNTMGWPAIMVSSTFGVLALACLTVIFFPYESYLPEVEAAFSQAIGRPAKVGTMQVSIYPKPGLFLGNVRIGADRHELRIAEIRLNPAISTLMASKKIFREAVLSGVLLPAELISGLPDAFIAMSKPTARAGIENILFEKTDVSLGGLGFSDMDGEAKLSGDGLFQHLALRSTDRSLNLEIKPIAQGFDVTLEGFGWRSSQGSPFLFDSVNLKGVVGNGVFTISSMQLRIFDGLIEGVAVLRTENEPSISGEIQFERINTTRLSDALGIGQQLAGETSGKIRFTANADSWPSIFSAINADGDFAMSRGSIRGIDLTEAARRISRGPVQGGATLFENLSGRIKLTPRSYQFSGLVMNSGLMRSTGHIEISNELVLSGTMDLEMNGTANQTRVPISISGPIKNPAVQAGKN